MHITLMLDEVLLAKAEAYTGLTDTSALAHASLEALWFSVKAQGGLRVQAEVSPRSRPRRDVAERPTDQNDNCCRAFRSLRPPRTLTRHHVPSRFPTQLDKPLHRLRQRRATPRRDAIRHTTSFHANRQHRHHFVFFEVLRDLQRHQCNCRNRPIMTV